jgi:hypothetical protein
MQIKYNTNFSEVDERADIIDEQHQHETSRLEERVDVIRELIVDYQEESPVNNSEDKTSDVPAASAAEIATTTSSSISEKRKFEQDEESSTQLSKSFKQDSSDITSDTELFDFCGGDD